MKKRNTTIFAFLLLAAVGMGVGYAAFSQPFSVGGTIKVNTSEAEQEFQKEIIFSAASAETDKADANKANVSESITLDAAKHIATLEVANLQAKGDICTVQLTVENNSDLPAVISGYTLTDTADTSLFKITVQDTLKNGATIDADGGTLPFTVTIEMLKDPVKTESYSFTIGFKADLNN